MRCPAPFGKIFPFIADPNHFYIPRRPAPHRGAFRDRHGRRARDAMDAVGAADESTGARTAKSCGPDASTLASSSRNHPRATVTRKPDHRGEHENKPLKPLRAGTPGETGYLWWLHSCATNTLHTRLRVRRAPGIPHALYWAEDSCTPRAHRVARSRNCVDNELVVIPAKERVKETDLILRSLRSKRLEGWTQRMDSRLSFETRARARSSG